MLSSIHVALSFVPIHKIGTVDASKKRKLQLQELTIRRYCAIVVLQTAWNFVIHGQLDTLVARKQSCNSFSVQRLFCFTHLFDYSIAWKQAWLLPRVTFKWSSLGFTHSHNYTHPKLIYRLAFFFTSDLRQWNASHFLWRKSGYRAVRQHLWQRHFSSIPSLTWQTVLDSPKENWYWSHREGVGHDQTRSDVVSLLPIP